jgi:hypothetical protein
MRNPSLRRRGDGFRDQIGQESDLIALPILRIAFMESLYWVREMFITRFSKQLSHSSEKN